jgi:hypothetical protein
MVECARTSTSVLECARVCSSVQRLDEVFLQSLSVLACHECVRSTSLTSV